MIIMEEVNIGLWSFMERCNGNVESVKGCGEV